MNKKVKVLFIALFFQGIVTNIHHPLMPFYVKELALPKIFVGLFFSLMSLGTMVGGPYWGNLGDRGKKRISIFIGLLIYATGQSLFGHGHIFSPTLLSLFRLVSGFGIAAALTLIMSEVIVVSEDNYKSKNIAYAAAITALGGSFGYLIGGLINTQNIFINLFKTDQFKNALLFQGISIVIFSIIFFITYKPEVIIKSDSKKTYFWEGFKEIKNIPKSLLYFLIALSIITFAYTNVDKYLEMYFADIGKDASMLGLFKMIVGFVSILVTFIFVPMFLKIKKRMALLSILQIITAIVVIIVFNLNTNWFIYLIYSVFIIYLIIKAIFTPLEQDYIASFSKDDNISMLMGIRQSFYSIGTIIGPLVGGLLYGVTPKLLFNISALMFLVAIIFLLLSKKQQQNILKKKE